MPINKKGKGLGAYPPFANIRQDLEAFGPMFFRKNWIKVEIQWKFNSEIWKYIIRFKRKIFINHCN